MKLTAMVHDCSLDGEAGFAARCAEFPEANGQGETVADAVHDLRLAIEEVVAFRREEARTSASGSDLLVELAT